MYDCNYRTVATVALFLVLLRALGSIGHARAVSDNIFYGTHGPDGTLSLFRWILSVFNNLLQ